MSNETLKADQVAHRFYTKLIAVVHHARTTAEPLSQTSKVDKWFNLETPDPDMFKEQTRIYRSISSTDATPVFQLQVLLCVPELTNNQVLVHLAPDSSRVRLDPAPKHILLESWDIAFSSYDVHYGRGDDRPDVLPPTMYKHGISMFRSVFTLLRILPAWKLARRLRRRTGGGRNGHFGIQLRVRGVEGEREHIHEFDTPLSPGAAPLATDTHSFPHITHPMGKLSLAVTYLTAPDFRIDELESLLSSRFLSLDEGPEFTPTLVKKQQVGSLSSSPGSVAARTSLPRSPPASVADRFVVPPPVSSRTTSFPTVGGSSPRMQSVALPYARRPSNAGQGIAGSASGLSDASSSRQGASMLSKDEGAVSTLAARLRKESVAGRSTDLSSPGPVPIRRSPITPVYPFKSSTLSSGSPSLHSPSPSLRQHSPLSSAPGAGPSLPSRPMLSSPTSSRVGGSIPPSISKAPSSPGTPLRPSSLDKRSSVSAEGVIPGESSRLAGKRYSSSFGHRYASTSATGSEVNPETSVKEGERATGVSLFGSNDDDDISAFVQDIDARRPLIGLREQSSSEDVPDSEPNLSPIAETRSSGSPLRSRTMSMPAPMLATEAAVDERLREMNEAFLSRLRGLGERRRARNGSGSVVPESGGSSALDDSSGISGIPLPATYIRPRLGSAASARSGMSIASGEVLGRMDPEVADGAGRHGRL